MATRQSSLVESRISEYKGTKFECEKQVGVKDNGENKICGNTASFVIDTHRESAIDKRKFYCGIHTRDTWKEMADNSQ